MKIAKKDLPAAESVASAKPLLETIEKRRARLATAREGATKDGTLVAHEPAFRTARKKLKRAQRRLRIELIRAKALAKPAAEAPAAAAAPAPAPAPEAVPAAEAPDATAAAPAAEALAPEEAPPASDPPPAES